MQVTELASGDDFSFLSDRKARIRVNETFGGLAPGQSEIDVMTGRGGGDCGIPFKPGETYLVDAFVSQKDGLVHAGICSSTRRIDEAGAALRILRERRDRHMAPSLAGQVTQVDRTFDGALGTEAKPLPNTLVRVKSEERSYETVADSDGLYAFYSLPSGRYEFDPDLPPGATLAWYLGSETRQPPFELEESGCEERNINVFASGSIQGRVLDPMNHPVPHAFVYIVPASIKEPPEEHLSYSESQGREGFFRFIHLLPGKYLVLVSPDDLPTAEFPYLRTFHPGVHERSAATTITVRAGEQIEGVDIRLQQYFEPRHLDVHVRWADGTQIEEPVDIIAKGTAKPELTSQASMSANATVSDLKILPDEPYEIQAELTCPYADVGREGPATLMSPKLYLKPADGQTELTFILPATSCPKNPKKKSVKPE